MLKLYHTISPNYSDNLHYVANDVASYLTKLQPYLYTELQETNFIFNGGTLQIKIPLLDIHKITYVVHVDGDYIRCFHVNDGYYQSGQAILNLSVDLWGTYYHLAKFSHTEITRTNANVDNFIFDNIHLSEGFNFDEIVTDKYSIDDFSNLGLVVHVVYQTSTASAIVSNSSSASKLFYFNTSKLPEGYQTIDHLIDGVGAIFGVQTTALDFEARTIKAWIVPKSFVRKGSTITPYFKCKTQNFETENLQPIFEVQSGEIRFDFPEIITNPDYEYFVGTIVNGLKCVPNKTIKTFSRIQATHDDLKIIIQQGDRAHEITQAFEVGLATNNGNITGIQGVKNVLGTFGKFMSAYGDFSSGDYGNAVYKTMSATTDMFGNSANASYVGGGMGLGLYRQSVGSFVVYTQPFVIVRHKSIFDEKKRFNETGGQTSIFVENPVKILENGLYLESTTPYIQASTNVSGIPQNAVEFITTEFQRGIRIAI